MNELNSSSITDYLYISNWPEVQHREQIQALGVQVILSMHWRKPTKQLNQPPLRLLWLPTFDSPLAPIPISALLRGVETALPVIQQEGGVLCHCKYGIHRSVAMACCVLIGKGYSADQAMALVKEKRSIADPYAGYIQHRIRIFEGTWNK